MNRVEFMKQLERLLWDIPENDRLDAIAYYNDYFDEAGVENEAQVIRELGSPEKVAAIIKEDLGAMGNQKKGLPWPLIIVLLVLASPVLLGVGGGLLGGLLGLFGALFGIVVAVIACGVAFLTAGIVLFAVGIVRVLVTPAEGLLTIGLGSLMLALGILFLLLFIWFAFKWIPALFRRFANLCQRIFHREERRSNA